MSTVRPLKVGEWVRVGVGDERRCGKVAEQWGNQVRLDRPVGGFTWWNVCDLTPTKKRAATEGET